MQYRILRPFARFEIGDIDELKTYSTDTLEVLLELKVISELIKPGVDTVDDFFIDVSNRPDWEKRFDYFLLHYFDRYVLCADSKEVAAGDSAFDCGCAFGKEIRSCNCICHKRIADLKKCIAEEIEISEKIKTSNTSDLHQSAMVA